MNVVGDVGDQAAAFALSQVGKPYEWGGNGPDSYDCTGLINAAYAAAGHPEVNSRLPKTAGAHYVGAADIQAGDILDYGLSHAAIAISPTQMVEAPFTGEFVRQVPIRFGVTAVERVVADDQKGMTPEEYQNFINGGLNVTDLPGGNVLKGIGGTITDISSAAVSAAKNLASVGDFLRERGRFILLLLAGLALTILGVVWLNKDLIMKGVAL